MKEAGLTEVGKSISNRQNTVAQYIATRPLLDLCEGASAREEGKEELGTAEQDPDKGGSDGKYLRDVL